MAYIDYEKEPKSDIAFVDMKSFYASVECVMRGLDPLRTSLCVMSRADNSSGLILAASPTFKKVFGKGNVGRVRDLPFDIETRKFKVDPFKDKGIRITKDLVSYIETWAERTLIVPPRMALYIEENLKIQEVFKNYAPVEEIYPYSIDEGFIDLTRSLNYFVPDKSLSRKDKLDQVSLKIQKDILKATGIYSTVGMSNANPLLAKLCLDNEAKKTKTMRANWSYEDVETKVWTIKNLTDFWGIGDRTARRLNKLRIFSIRDLANANPDRLEKEFGIIGLQLWFHANGVDESNVKVPYIPKSKGLGNSQILPHDYTDQGQIELVLGEMADQVARRIRSIGKLAGVVSIYVGYSYKENLKSINVQEKIMPTAASQILRSYVLGLFRKHYEGGAVRRLGVRYDNLVDKSYRPFSFFDDLEKIEKMEALDLVVDEIRNDYGFLAIKRGDSLLEGARAIERSKLIGGHCGGMEGIK
ncbi:Y-family DNA polymerase [Neofamilia massiliensis]|uniref:Y-family DNA polymerase n=1 Tax=Neofamilia massiliensis TaxID=1673724 RepID=UPI0006BB5C6A|nr:Y-family DNA polymerase [Neofamilia massiliensis]